MQMPTPPHANAMPSVPKVVEKSRSHPDMFLDLIQGAPIPVIVGSGPSSRTYVLPINLLCAHSVWLRNEINYRVSENSHLFDDDDDDNVNKKRPLTSNTNDDSATESKPIPEFAICLPNVDPFIFGLMLKYMYTLAYPKAVDGRPAPPAPPAPSGSRIHQSPYPIPTHSGTAAHAPGAIYTNAPEVIPPSVRAYLLAHRLGAISFGNYAIGRVYDGFGVHFAITPGLINFVWRQTTPSLTPTVPGYPVTVNPTPAPATATAAQINATPTSAAPASPLRMLFVHALIEHWSSPNVHLINKTAGMQRAWDQLFEAHPDLQRILLYGLARGVKMRPVQGYYTVSAAVAQGVRGPGAAQGGSAATAQAGTRGAVAVEKEQEDDGGDKMAVKMLLKLKEGNGAGGDAGEKEKAAATCRGGAKDVEMDA